MDVGVGARELYESLAEGNGTNASWLGRDHGGYRDRLATAAEHRPWWTAPEGQAVLWELYALSRVGDLLLHEERAYLGLFTPLGMTPFKGGTFDPFLHEIVEVDQADDPGAPIEITEVVWPGLMLGQLLFTRAGVRVRAGADHAQRGVADGSPLSWAFRRRHRPTVDLSHGWGHNSQWRTDFRLDYRTPDGDRLNVAGHDRIDGRPDLDPDHPANLGPEERLLTPGERRELLRHRCLLRVPRAADALARTAGWERDLMPFDWRLP
ncbi:hypothetical protein [Streptomyces doebereineriae]|uniref:Uncharacterized protein n=1 Tax=Streptomyces doebereineriae TaxID=3075528 RepID=A0ABU2VC21_9ACTN|nr:hypothetical protein [Streptomyces sp. DSM 41640]MDT0483110.1 hypothetical protein [Streptomyces sp. DSM 41640]